MAFDQTTRNRLQSFVSSARNILSQEFTRQLQADYGMDPKQGTVDDLSTLTHLNNSQRQTAQLLRDTLEHYLATTPGKSDKERTKQVLERIIREQAFTVLNRLAALRMAEAREFLIESIGKSQSSKGFQLYRQLAGTSHGETGDAYRNYLFSLFDEFSVDLAVLFDRHSIQGRLFPRESALLELLAEINHQEIDALWAEDETIGWIYQYFNSQEERKKMRSESQAPRNSRELAVRNQFFTPRYVVEFLTDNTLGRIWCEMTQGNTALVDSCSYLVRRPTEVFLKPGEQAPDTGSTEDETLSQEELLQQTVYIPHRKLKDPRNIRMLDPACGSMHFGLYAFDLFEQIYLEAWQLEQELGPDAFQREANQQALQTSFSSLEEFRTQIPKLIIENNIHGVDIDPRAVQIAGLSLWQRAQRAWQLQGIKPQQRPVIIKSNIVCAEPMPGDKALLQEFTSQLNPPVLGQLLEVIFDKMQLAGEAGTLLKIEEEIQTAIKDARNQWQQQSGRNSVSDMFQTELDAAIPQQKLGFDLRGIDDETFWDDAEQLILEALSNYANQAESSADQKRLFAEDAAKGFAFIDLCRKRFDVVLMNPPFGEPSDNLKAYLKNNYSNQVQDLYCLFVERGVEFSNESNVGAITSSSFLKYNDYSKFRSYLIEKNYIDILSDLGWEVLDDAYVSASAYIVSKINNNSWVFLDHKESKIKSDGLLNDCSYVKIGRVSDSCFVKKPLSFKSIDGFPLCYSFPDDFFSWVKSVNKLIHYTENNGIGAGPHNFFFRLNWEVSEKSFSDNGRWPKLPNGGQFSPYYRSINLLLDWRSDGQFIKEHLRNKYPYLKGNIGIKIQRENMYFRKGITYGKRTDRFNAQIMPEGCIPSFEGIAIYPLKEKDTHWILSYLNSRFVAYYLNLTSGLHKNSVYLDRLPVPEFDDSKKKALTEISEQSIFKAKAMHSVFETDNGFYFASAIMWLKEKDNIKNIVLWFIDIELELAILSEKCESIVNSSIPLSGGVFEEVIADQGLLYSDDLSLVKRQALAIPKTFGNSELLKNTISKKINSIEELKENIIISEDRKLWLINYVLSLSVYNIFKNNRFSIVDVGDKKTSIDKLVESYLYSEFENTSFYYELNFDNEFCLIDYFSKNNGFFAHHYKEYSASGRNAPIYWPLQTPTGSYTLWVYYHDLSEQTLYSCVNNFIEGPSGKLTRVEQDLNVLKAKSARTSQEEIELTQLTDLANELKDFRDELLRLAKFWKPNLNDGVQITAAPLWKLFQHKVWQKKLQDTWEKLEKGDFDWAHLAYSVWPERVLRKCHQDRSLAIAHDVEDIFWHEVEVPVKRGAKLTGEMKTEWQPKSLTETELTELINQTITDLK